MIVVIVVLLAKITKTFRLYKTCCVYTRAAEQNSPCLLSYRTLACF